MRPVEQIAFRTANMDHAIAGIHRVHPFIPYTPLETKWVTDRVTAVHVYTHHDYFTHGVHPGDLFNVKLAFNYDLIPGRELELIQLMSGITVQLPGNHTSGLSHLGYHIPDGAILYDEIQWWKDRNFPCAQISATTEHSGTEKRYLYAFIDTRPVLGVFTKVIARVMNPRPVESLIEEFEHVGAH